jgi:iron(III) transport system ATP-binding protein
VSELVVRGLTKSFGDHPVLRGVDLTVPTGTLAAVLGPSGCGKTTLLRIVAGFENPDAGEVSIGGTTVAGPGRTLPPERRRVGIVPQEGALFPHLTVAANVGFGLQRGSRGSRGSRDARVQAMLELVGLGEYGPRLPHQLSGGQQQRVALARALAPDPALVLLDEPFSALDTGLRASVREDVRAALRATGATAVLVTHDQQEALSMASLVAVLQDGHVVQAAAPADLYAVPATLAVATFLGDAVVLPAQLDGDGARCALGVLPARMVHAGNGACGGNGVPAAARDGAGRGTGARGGTVMLRPEQIVLGPADAGVPARVTTVRFFGHDALVHLALPGSDEPVLARTLGRQTVHAGDEVGLTVAGVASFFPGST